VEYVRFLINSCVGAISRKKITMWAIGDQTKGDDILAREKYF